MIKHILQGRGLTVSSYGQNYINTPSSSQVSAFGTLRYNPENQNIEVYNGNSWVSISYNVEVKLDNDTEELLNWVRVERDRIKELERLAKENVTIRDALDKYRNSAEQLKVIETLCKTEKNN